MVPPSPTKASTVIDVAVVTGVKVSHWTFLAAGQVMAGASMSTVHLKVTWHVADGLPLASLAVTSKIWERVQPVPLSTAPATQSRVGCGSQMSLTPLTFVFARAQSGSVGLQPKSKLADGHVIEGPTQSLTTTIKVQGLPGTAESLAVHVTVVFPNGNAKDGVTTVPL